MKARVSETEDREGRQRTGVKGREEKRMEKDGKRDRINARKTRRGTQKRTEGEGKM